MTTAEIHYKPSRFCDIEFFGDNSHDYMMDCLEIEQEEFLIHDKKAESLKSILNEMLCKRKEEKKWYIFWFTEIDEQISLMKTRIKEEEEKRFKSERTLKREYYEYLLTKGFTLVGNTPSGDGYSISFFSKE